MCKLHEMCSALGQILSKFCGYASVKDAKLQYRANTLSPAASTYSLQIYAHLEGDLIYR